MRVYEPENNDKYGYPNGKTSTQNLVTFPYGQNEHSSLYSTKVIFGTTNTADQVFNLLIDTGSSWTWVKACDKDTDNYWATNRCPDQYFDL